jgi:MFS transporter, ACS family, glucarate transporter
VCLHRVQLLRSDGGRGLRPGALAVPACRASTPAAAPLLWRFRPAPAGYGAATVPYRYRTLIFLFFLSVVTYLDRVCISVAGPRMQADLGLSTVQWGWVVGAFTIGYALFEIPGGMMADRWGARTTLTRIVLFWSAFTAATGAVSGFGMLLLVRFLFGAGEAGAFPGATSAISRWFPARERSRAQGVVWMASRVGGMISPWLVVPIQLMWGWRASFYLFGAVGILWCVSWFLWYRDRPRDKKGVTQQELEVIESGAPAGGHGHLVWRKVMKKANFWKLLFAYHGYAWGSFFYLSWLHTYLIKGRGFTEQEMKTWSAIPFLLGGLGCLLGGTLSDHLTRKHGAKFGRRVVGTTGLALGAVFLFGAALTEDKLIAAVCLCLGYFAMDLQMPVSWALPLDLGRRSAGSIAGAMNMAGQLGSFLSSVAFGYLVRAFDGDYSKALLPLAGMTVLSAIVFSRIDPTQPLVDDEPPLPVKARPAVAPDPVG